MTIRPLRIGPWLVVAVVLAVVGGTIGGAATIPVAAATPTPTPLLGLPTPTLPPTPPPPTATPLPTTPTPTVPPTPGGPTPTPTAAPGGGATPTPSPVASGTAGPASSPTGAPANPSPAATPCPTGSAAAATPSPGTPANADPCANQRLIQEVRERLGGALADALATQDQLVISLQNSARQQEELRARIDASSRTVADLESRTAGLEQRSRETEGRIAAERVEVATMARSLYRRPNTLLAYVVSTHGLREMLLSVASLNAAGGRAHSLEAQLTQELEQLRQDRGQQQQLRDQEAAVRAHMAEDLAKMADLESRQQASIGLITAQIAAVRAELDAVGSQSPELAARITDRLAADQLTIISLAMRQVWTQILLYLDATGASRAGSAPGSLGWPMTNAVLTQPFGPSGLGLEPAYQGYPHFHTGLDLAAPAGTPVGAAAAGLVALAGNDGVGYGRYVVVAHEGGLTTLYGHLSQVLVAAGDRVDQGQPVGLEGSTGNSTGPHLHFEVRVNGVLVDPMPYLPAPSAAPPANG